jgi:AcrR family transcriptional regulator
MADDDTSPVPRIRRPESASFGATQPGQLPRPEDGRHMRSAASRRRILKAMLDLVQEGDPDPAAEAVAARANVGLRTVFRLFRDMESICAEMLKPEREDFIVCFTARFTAPRGPNRVRELFGRLARLYERGMPLRRAGVIRRYSSPSLAAAIKELDDTIDAFLRLQQLSGDEARLDMLNLLLSYEAWLRLRDSQNLSYERTLAILTAAIERYLA